MKHIYIVKPDGSKRKFSFKRMVQSVQRAGASKSVADKVARSVLKQLPTEISSGELYNLIYKALNSETRPIAQVYSLRPALAQIRPDVWEKYIAKVFAYYGYETIWNVIVPGASVEHQVDVIAMKENQLWLVECKHHFDYHKDTGLGEILQVQARLEDVQDGFKKGTTKYDFTGAWLVTNTKFSDHAKRYGMAKKINLTGWRYPEQYSLERLIQDQSVYPITILNMDKHTKNLLMNNDIITIQEVEDANKNIIKLLGNKYGRLLKQIEGLHEQEI